MKNLPLSIQTFEKLRKNNCVYVDKTELIYNLVQSGTVYFLSRPRRFGKSLLISTLDAYFNGRRDLFEGLKIAQLEKEWKQYPVIHIDFGGGDYYLPESIDSKLNNILSRYEEEYGIIPDSRSVFADRFENLIREIYKQTQQQVVVLIDEYDKPVLDALYMPHEERNRAELRAFYSVLKSNDANLKFIFLTGITRVTHVNIFSGLNQIQDISMNKKYAALCGITKDELMTDFADWISDMAAENDMTVEECLYELKRMYDGYHFCKVSPDIFNPYSILNAFSSQEFGSYWYGSGTPSSLVRVLERQTTDVAKFVDEIQVYEESFNNFQTNNKGFLSLIYQSGYLTIKGYDKESKLYKLGIPNVEVQDGFYKSLLPRVSPITNDDLGITIDHYRYALLECDLSWLETLIKSSIANLPYMNDKSICEDMYRNVLHMIFTLTGFATTSESVSLCGRADTVVELSDKVYIFEYKMLGNADPKIRAAEALAQIDDKHYADKYEFCGKKIIKLALVFDLTGLQAMANNNEI